MALALAVDYIGRVGSGEAGVTPRTNSRRGCAT